MLRFLGHVAIVGGVLLVVDAGLTLLWQEPVSAWLNGRAQAELRADLEGVLGSEAPGGVSRRELRDLATDVGARTGEGEALAEIEIPSIGVSQAVVEGTEAGSLRKGPGHYEQTVLPGQRGTVAVAGHRTTNGAPFRDIDKLGKGDEIVVRTPYGRFVYEFEESEIVDPSEISAIDDLAYDRIVLTACHPLYSAAQRIVVSARLTMTPAGPVRRPGG